MRKALLSLIIVVISLIFIGRLGYLQLSSISTKNSIEDTAVKKIFDYPERGYIYDRNGKLLVANQASYDVMVIPREVKTLDTLEFCNLLKISKEEFIKKYATAKNYSTWLPYVFVSQLSKSDYAVLQEKMRKYEGFYIQKRSLRDYHTKNAANVLGYIREVNQRDIKNNPSYYQGELRGIQGVEEQYEGPLRGRKGVKHIQKDRLNRDIGSYKNGQFDTLPESGKELQLTLDIDLQAYGELLMQNKRGGIVAIEPQTGELLSLVSAPSYDPSLLVGRKRSRNYTLLSYDSIANPLFDRGLLAQYPPGSPIKSLNALIALEEGVIDEDFKVTCYNGYYYGKKKRRMACHCPSGARHNLNSGLAQSCNAYFATIYKKTIEKYSSSKEGIDVWSKHIKSFGLGNYLGYDLPIGKRGKIPTSETYDRMYPNHGWFATNTISNAIGQGEILTTPIQLANITAAIANKGYYFTPHVVKKIGNKPLENQNFTTPKYTTISKKHFDPIIKGMFDVYNYGTASSIQIAGVKIAGKTGTAQNAIKIDGKRTPLTDHSIFIAFAPVDNPKIAIAVFVENGRWGNRWAGRIASLMVEKYLKKEISNKRMEDFILNGSLEEEYAKVISGKPFRINE